MECFSCIYWGLDKIASTRTSRIDTIINDLKSLERIDGDSETLKMNAIAYLELYADYLDRKGIKAIKKKKCPGAATPDGHTEK